MSTITQVPVHVGTSIVGVKYKDGILLACDTLVNQGRCKKHLRVQRMAVVGKDTIVTASGEHSDLQHVLGVLYDIEDKDFVFNDGAVHTASAMHSYITRMTYKYRNKMDPLYGTFVVAGKETDGSFFIGTADLWGTAVTGEDFVATGLASWFSTPLFRNEARPDMSEEEARALLVKALKVNLSVDMGMAEEIQFAKITNHGAAIEEPTFIKPNWDVKGMKESRMGLPLCAYPY